jgi:hypothetical protein
MALIALVFAAAPNLMAFWLPMSEFRPGAEPYVWVQMIQVTYFLISPCILFVVLYIYGKRTARYFGTTYLMAFLFLFLGSGLGYAVYLSSLPLLGVPHAAFSDQFWLTAAFEMVSSGLEQAFVGFAALALASLRIGSVLSSSGRGSSPSDW